MENIKQLAKNRKAKALWGEIRSLIRETRGKITGEHAQSVYSAQTGGVFSGSVEYFSDHESPDFWSTEAEAAPEPPKTDPKKVVLTRTQRQQQHPDLERMRDLAFRHHMSPNVRPQPLDPRGGTAHRGPGPDLDPVYNRAINKRKLHKEQAIRDWRTERRDRYNGRGSPTEEKSGGGAEVLDNYVGDNLVEVERDEYVTDITTRPPPKFNLGPAAVRKSETPKPENDPFTEDAAW